MADCATPEQMRQWLSLRARGENDFDLERIQEAVEVAEEDSETWREDAKQRVEDHFVKEDDNG